MEIKKIIRNIGRQTLANVAISTAILLKLAVLTTVHAQNVGADPATAALFIAFEERRQEISAHANSAQSDLKDELAVLNKRLRDERKLGAMLDELVTRSSATTNGAAGERLNLLVASQFTVLEEVVDTVQTKIGALRSERAAAEIDDLLESEYQLRDYDDMLSGFFLELVDNGARAAALGMEAGANVTALDDELVQRAEQLAERIETTRDRIRATRKRQKTIPEDRKAILDTELIALEERRQRIKRGLEATINLLRKRDIEVDKYVRVLVATTGQLSGDVLDSKILMGLANDWMQVSRDLIVDNGPAWIFRLLMFLLILGIAKILANIVAGIVRRAVGSSRMNFSTLLQGFFVKLASNVVLIIGLLVGLAQLGIHLGPVLAGFGVAGLIVGFALQDTLSNFASGLMILIYRPYDVDDVIEAGGVSGKVKQMSLVSTTILTFDNQKLVVPNNKIWGDVIRNVNAAPTRRVDLTFGVSYDDDIAKTEAILKDIIATHPLVLADPEPNIRLHELADSSVNFIVRPWVKADDYWTVYWDVTRAVKERFDAEGISIPFPQRDVHVYQESS